MGIEFESIHGKATIEICDDCLRDLARSHLGSSLFKTKITKEEFMTAYDEGKSDANIARLLNINIVTVRHYRSLYQLPPKGARFKLPYKEKKKRILKLFHQKGVLLRDDLPKGYGLTFTKLLFDQDVDVITYRFIRVGRSFSSAELFQEDIVGKTVYFLREDERIIDFIASKLKKPITASKARVLRYQLKNFNFTTKEASLILEKAGD